MQKYEEYTISDVIRLKPTWLIQKQTDQYLFLKKINTIAEMINSGMHYISHYKFNDVFNGYEISMQPIQEINRQIFEYKKTKDEELAQNEYVDNTEMISQAKDDGKLKFDYGSLNNKIARINNAISDEERVIRDKENGIKRESGYILNARQRVKELRDEKCMWEEKIKQSTDQIDETKLSILNSIPKNYKLLEVRDTTFIVGRMTPVIITESNPKSGMSRHFNIGYYSIELDYGFDTKRLMPMAGNFYTSYNSVHPHAKYYSICWGNLSNLVIKAAQKEDSSIFFKALDNLLENYNYNDPYINLDDFLDYEIASVNIDYAERFPKYYEEIMSKCEDKDLLKEYNGFLSGDYNTEEDEEKNVRYWDGADQYFYTEYRSVNTGATPDYDDDEDEDEDGDDVIDAIFSNDNNETASASTQWRF